MSNISASRKTNLGLERWPFVTERVPSPFELGAAGPGNVAGDTPSRTASIPVMPYNDHRT